MKAIKTGKLFILTSIILVFGSCARIIVGMYGVNRTHTFVNQDNLAVLAKEYNVPLRDWFELDTLYFHFIRSFDDEVHFCSKRDHTQLLQILYFNQNGDLISFFTNCYAGGFPNLRWNRNNLLNTFVPKSRAPIDTLVNFDRLFSFFE